MTWHSTVQLLRITSARWSRQNVPRLGASLAYYTLLSLAPLLILVIRISGLVFDKTTAQAQVLEDVRQIAGQAGVQVIQMLIANAHKPSSGVVATIIAI